MKTVVLFPDPSVMLKFQGLGEGKRITHPVLLQAETYLIQLKASDVLLKSECSGTRSNIY
jgi:hypothetical protein